MQRCSLPEVDRLTGHSYGRGALPDYRAESYDVYVWAEDLAWTMAFTHEESLGLGPYFSRREWVVPSRRPKR